MSEVASDKVSQKSSHLPQKQHAKQLNVVSGAYGRLDVWGDYVQKPVCRNQEFWLVFSDPRKHFKDLGLDLRLALI